MILLWSAVVFFCVGLGSLGILAHLTTMGDPLDKSAPRRVKILAWIATISIYASIFLVGVKILFL